MKAAIVTIVLGAFLANAVAAAPVWPPPPGEPRVEWEGEIRFADLSRERSFLGKVGSLLGGGDESDHVSRPFDLAASGDHLYLTCQDLPALVRVNVDDSSFKLFECKDQPLESPIAVTARDGAVYVSDSGSGIVYVLADGELRPFVSEGLERPTGLAFLPDGGALVVVDTGDHSVKTFDGDGRPAGTLAGRGEVDAGFNFPTFAVGTDRGVLVNDTLNYRLKTIAADGTLVGAFGEEGDGPGTLARPKGVAVDDADQVWVADAIFDNVQVFDDEGRLLLVIGASGHGPGEFWTPGGIEILDDMVYVADTFNDRIQVLRILGGDHD